MRIDNSKTCFNRYKTLKIASDKMKNPRKNQMSKVAILTLVAVLGCCSAQDGMSSNRRSGDGDEVQVQSSEQRFLREPLDQVI